METLFITIFGVGCTKHREMRENLTDIADTEKSVNITIKEVSDVDSFLEKGIHEVRVVHGKGIGNLRRTVHAILDRLPYVSSYSLAHELNGGWGATMVWLRETDAVEESGVGATPARA